MADQLSAPALPMYGNRVVQAPNLERLADHGAVFDNCYCNFPLCAPSRASLMTGQLASKIGAYDNAAELPAAIPTLTHHLRKMGYRTVISGKMHFVGPDQLHGFGERLTTEIYPSDFTWTPDWETNLSFQDMHSVREAGICQRSMQLDYDEEGAHGAVQKIYDLAREPEKKPFFLTVSFTHPHDPYITLPEYWNRYKHEEIDLPAVPGIADDKVDPLSRRLNHHFGVTRDPVTEEQIRNARHAYYGSISYIDDKIGQLLNTLDETGFGDDTLVVFTTDHGDMLGERGMWYKKAFFEWSAKVPLIMAGPGKPNSRRVNGNVSLVDLFPTFIDLAGGELSDIVSPIDGHSLRDLLEGGDNDQWPDTVYAEMLAEGVQAPCYMIRRGRYKFIYSPGDSPLLFDMVEDPMELVDLAKEADYAAIKKEFMREMYQKWDTEKLTAKILTSQKQRQLVMDAHKMGQAVTWDYYPGKDESKRFIRSSEKWTDIDARYYLPAARSLKA